MNSELYFSSLQRSKSNVQLPSEAPKLGPSHTPKPTSAPVQTLSL